METIAEHTSTTDVGSANPTLAILPARELKALAAFAAQDDVRSYLNGVLLDHQSRVLVATNGHTLAVLRGDDIGDTAFTADRIVPIGAITAILKGAKASDRIVIRMHSMTNATKGTAIDYEPIDGRFPDWRKAVPGPILEEDRDSSFAHFDARYLKLAHDLFHAVNDRKRTERSTVELRTNGPNNAAVVFGNTQRAFAVIMPYRAHPEAAEKACTLYSMIK